MLRAWPSWQHYRGRSHDGQIRNNRHQRNAPPTATPEEGVAHRTALNAVVDLGRRDPATFASEIGPLLSDLHRAVLDDDSAEELS